MRTITLIGLVAAVVSLTLGCDTPDDENLGPPDIRGVIMDVSHADGMVGILRTLFIEVDPAFAAAVQYDRASITVRIDTDILRRENDGTNAATFEDLQFGELVDVWFTGPGEYYPVEATARQIVLLGKVLQE